SSDVCSSDLCMLCQATGIELHVDHIKPRSTHPDLALDENNLQVLCKPCNLGKRNRDDADFRPSSKAEKVVELARLAHEYLSVRASRIEDEEKTDGTGEGLK